MNVNDRNLRAVHEEVKLLSERLYVLVQRFDSVQATLSMCVDKIAKIEQERLLQKVRTKGSGPTSPSR